MLSLIAVILTLHIQTIFADTSNIALYCSSTQAPGYVIGACNNGSNRVYLNLDTPGDINEHLGHEIGHILSYGNSEIHDLIAPYPAPRSYPKEFYPDSDSQLEEKVADYWAMYFKYPDFHIKFPAIALYMDNYLQSLKSNH